jgi:hypothetical protein
MLLLPLAHLLSRCLEYFEGTDDALAVIGMNPRGDRGVSLLKTFVKEVRPFSFRLPLKSLSNFRNSPRSDK